MRLTTVSAALAVVALVGYFSARQEGPWNAPPSPEAPLQARGKAAPQPAGTLPAPFKAGTGTPGESVQALLAMRTPGAAFDAFVLIDRCMRHERYRTGESATHCNGITQGMRNQAGELLVRSMDAGIPGAPTEVLRVLLEAAEVFKDEPKYQEAARHVVSKLEENARRDREAISSLSKLYANDNPITGRRDLEKALMYYTAATELRPEPGMEAVKKITLDSFAAELTHEQVQRAQAAGVQLARNCDCRG